MEIKSVTKQQLAYEKIKEGIITERYKPDDMLSTRELSAELGISRTPVAAALRRLSYEGFVIDVPDKGMFVSGVHIEDYIELYEIRMGMEGLAARLCAMRRNSTLVSRLDEILLSYERAVRSGNYLKAVQRDNEFHLAFISGAGNTRLENYMRIIIEQCAHAVNLSASMPGRLETAILPAHRKIYEAIAARNPDGAEQAAREHVIDVQGFLTQYKLRRYTLK